MGENVRHLLNVYLIAALFTPLAFFVFNLAGRHGASLDVMRLPLAEQIGALALLALPVLVLRRLGLLDFPNREE